MSALNPENPRIRKEVYQLFRDFFRLAEKKRRWLLDQDIPWDQVNRNLPAEIADVVETFCMVELYLPDYVAKALPQVRGNKGWAWFYANWGYEESKHSLALGDWLLRSGHRTEEQMFDIENGVFEQEWHLPFDNGPAMLIYSMAQELSTWLHYRNLREHVEVHGDPALSTLLQYIAVDERAHHSFLRDLVKLYLDVDREGTLEQLRRVLHNFHMPAADLLAQSKQREAKIRALGLFSEEIYYKEVYEYLLNILGVTRKELRRTAVTAKP